MYYGGGTFSKNSCFERRFKTLAIHFLFFDQYNFIFLFQYNGHLWLKVSIMVGHDHLVKLISEILLLVKLCGGLLL
jgi:hypothetical protein